MWLVSEKRSLINPIFPYQVRNSLFCIAYFPYHRPDIIYSRGNRIALTLAKQHQPPDRPRRWCGFGSGIDTLFDILNTDSIVQCYNLIWIEKRSPLTDESYSDVIQMKWVILCCSKKYLIIG
jgi:hypothetical protein